MKLLFANTSPYARKARMVVLEKGLEARVEAVFQNPFEECPALKSTNPLGKVPALVKSDGNAVFDSPVICAYLDSLTASPRLIPDGDTRWAILTAEALADGILDSAYAIVMERRRAAPEQSSMWLDRWETGIIRTAAALESDLAVYQGELNLAHIALGAALGYLDFRLPDINWRTGHPALSDWFEVYSQRPSMQTTDPAIS